MACLDMYSSSSSSASNNQTSDHNKSLPCSSPRISFSNDFAESNHHHQHQHQHHHHKPRSDHPPPPPSTDFEFSSVSNHSMMSADELFSKGRLLPFKKPTTLREELLTGDDEDEEDGGFSLRPPKGSGSGSMRWKEILGLKKSHNVGSRKTGKGDGCGERRPGMGRDPEVHLTKSSQELLNDGRSSSRDVEFGM